METLKVFDEKFRTLIKSNVKSVLLENSSPNEPKLEIEAPAKLENILSCSYCRVEFPNLKIQREHYKLDWHRYNLKQSLLNRASINEEEFLEKTNADDLSSISGSDSEKEDNLDIFAIAQGKIFLQSETGSVISLYRCLIYDKKEEPCEQLTDRLRTCCVTNKSWTILMLGGGHFAGAVFEADKPIVHKTFHCYTVRAGQGGSQSSRDGKSGGSHPKSAGASLRRYNEQALVQHVKGIVDLWKSEIEKSSLIFYRASGPYNRSVLFGGATPLLQRTDARLRTIPFSTRRPTFTEVQRVHSVLSLAHIYSSLDEAASLFEKQHKTPALEPKKSRIVINRAKSREEIHRPLPGERSLSESSDGSVALKFEDISISLEDSLQEFDNSFTFEERAKAAAPKKKKVPKKSKNKKLKEREEARKNELIDVYVRGDLEKLKSLYANHLKTIEEEEESPSDFINEVLDDKSNTPLHLAAMNEHSDLVAFLMENGGNPCLRNKAQHTVYTATFSKAIREDLKQFAKDFPDKFNYNKAQIPTNTLSNEEQAEKKKAQRKIKRDKEKEKRKENEVKKQENDERDRFLKLSDREKRALAAERRILSQNGKVVARCFLCASDMAGKVPFEYLGNNFCTMECLKAHRMKGPLVLS